MVAKGFIAELLGILVLKLDALGEVLADGNRRNNLGFAQRSDEVGARSLEGLHDLQVGDNVDDVIVNDLPVSGSTLKLHHGLHVFQAICLGGIDGQREQLSVVGIGKALQHGEPAFF